MSRLNPFCRGVAVFFGLFFVTAGLSRIAQPKLDLALWCLDLRWLPLVGSVLICVGFGGMLLAGGLGIKFSPQCRRMALVFTSLAILQSLIDSVNFWRIMRYGLVRSDFPWPASLCFLGGLIVASGVWWCEGNSRERAWPRHALVGLGLSLSVLLFPLVQIYTFGFTDYRRKAEVAVVLGARVYADGSLSQAVRDRVDTAARLFHQGWIQEIWVSGGPGDGTIHEAQAMRRRLIERGVPPNQVQQDFNGWNTAATVRNTGEFLGGKRVLVVSEFFHLPRIKLAYAAAGMEVYTVPAEASHWLRRWDLRSISREIPAFWLYYLRALRPHL